MKRDKLLVAALIGGLSTIAGEIVTWILVWLGAGQYAVFELNSLLLTNNQPSMLIGFIINFIIGGHLAAAFYLLFKWLGDEHIVVKCILGSMMLWFVFELGFTSLIEDKYIPIRPIADHIVHITGTAAFGLTVGVFMRLLLFPNGRNEKERD